MSTTDKKDGIKAIPTNIISGFLGVGKTSTILELLKHKPSTERWAILVNEFGEIGVDGSLFAGQHTEQQGIYIKEVPGGCMCCAAGLPMQIALNQLLARSKPDRLLIEPTGLGHPFEVLEVLSSETYQQIISLQKTLTLVDARKLSDERYTKHDTFNQQIAMADIIIGNKQDLYRDKQKTMLFDYIQQHAQANVRVVFTEYGKIDPNLLLGNSTFKSKKHHHHAHQPRPLLSEEPISEKGYIKAINKGEGYQSMGWRFSPDKVFDRNKLFLLLSGINVERMKAIFITEQGVMAYNLTESTLTEAELDECFESRIELIYQELNGMFESELIQCILQ